MAMNFVIYAIGMLGFWICGFALMFGGLGAGRADRRAEHPRQDVSRSTSSASRGSSSATRASSSTGPANDATVLTLFLFQMVFMDTAATIPTGAMAERWKFSAFGVYGFFLSMLIYPVFGCWVWGGGWLADLGANFGLGNGHVDFAGSSVVHMTGGVTALAGAIVLGPRIGKFNKDGSPNAIPAHNVPMVVLGTLILAFGWFGFNPGSSLAATDLRIGSVAVCTMLASARRLPQRDPLHVGRLRQARPDDGLQRPARRARGHHRPVRVRRPGRRGDHRRDRRRPGRSGACSSSRRVLKVDDPVGAISVHGVCGALGLPLHRPVRHRRVRRRLERRGRPAPTGLFYGGGLNQLAAEAIGVADQLPLGLPLGLRLLHDLEKTIGNRVPAKAEIEGLDIPEMGVPGYVNEDTIAVQVAGQEHLQPSAPASPRI